MSMRTTNIRYSFFQRVFENTKLSRINQNAKKNCLQSLLGAKKRVFFAQKSEEIAMF